MKCLSLVNNKAPCSPFLMMTEEGPNFRALLAAWTRLVVLNNSLASPSFSTNVLVFFMTFSTSSFLFSIQKFMVSVTTQDGFSTCSNTANWTLGSMLARKTYLAFLYASGNFGGKFS